MKMLIKPNLHYLHTNMSKFRTFLANETIGADPYNMTGGRAKLTKGDLLVAALEKLNTLTHDIESAIRGKQPVGTISGAEIQNVPEKTLLNGPGSGFRRTRGGLTYNELQSLEAVGVIVKNTTGTNVTYTIRPATFQMAYKNAKKQAAMEKMTPANLAKQAGTFIKDKILGTTPRMQPWWQSTGFG